MRTAVFPGSFDPFTLGHLDLLARAAGLFDQVIVAVGRNAAKAGFLPIEQRVALIEEAAGEAGIEGVAVADFEGLTIDFAVSCGATWIVRGLRGAGDVTGEFSMAGTNRAVEPSLDTVFLPTSPQVAHVQARWVREMVQAGRPVDALVPPCVARALQGRGRASSSPS